VPALILGLLSPMKFYQWATAAIGLEFLAEFIRIRKAKPQTGLRVSAEATLVRLSNDLGRVLGNFSRRRLGFMERFDYFTTGESIGYERKVAIVKLVSFLLSGVLFYFL